VPSELPIDIELRYLSGLGGKTADQGLFRVPPHTVQWFGYTVWPVGLVPAAMMDLPKQLRAYRSGLDISGRE
jgi:hypothetical protein